ncbi:MAG: glycoside hydrolase family 28 protein, partial [Clostridia bacterium]|nr:glycoside hydrolase family 28 protein [Clostridia bacterium]
MFKKLFISSTSACFEQVNKNPYYCPFKYVVLLNGKEVGGERDANVFSLFNLDPDTEYTVKTMPDGYSLKFRTEKESAVIDVKSLGAKGDGNTDDTYFVQMAIDSCPEGGRVLLSGGDFLVRPIV